MIEKERCTYKDSVYSHDAAVCTVDKCMRCNDGEWQEMDASACCWDSPFRREMSV